MRFSSSLVPDAQGHNPLYYAIKGNFNLLIKNIFNGVKESLPLNLIATLAELHDYINYCISHKQFETLKILLDFVTKNNQALENNFEKSIDLGRCFKLQTLQTLSEEQIFSLKKIMIEYPDIKIDFDQINNRNAFKQ